MRASPHAGDTFQFLTATGGIAGQFDTLLLPALLDGSAWKLFYGTNAVTLSATLRADYNGDLTVNAADYTVWRNTLGQSVIVGMGADGTGPLGVPDGIVDFHDFQYWKDSYGQSVAGSGMAAESISVPEPATVALILTAVPLVYRRTRKMPRCQR